MHFGIICACLPAHRQLFSKIVPKVFGSTKGTSNSSSEPSSKFDVIRNSSFIPLKDVERGESADKCIVVTSELSIQTEDWPTHSHHRHSSNLFAPAVEAEVH